MILAKVICITYIHLSSWNEGPSIITGFILITNFGCSLIRNFGQHTNMIKSPKFQKIAINRL